MAELVQVQQVPAGGHACLTFTDADERLDLLAVFIGDGLDAGARVVCYSDGIPPAVFVDELTHRSVPATAAAEHGQLVVADCAAGWLGADTATAEQMLDAVRGQARSAAEAGFSGLRVAADMAWAARPHAAAHELLRFEHGFRDVLTGGGLTTICQYDRSVFDPVTLAFAADVHGQAVAAQVYHEDPLLRICRQYRPAGIRIAGELDFRHLDVLQQALAETLRLDECPQVNLRRLRYVDGTCAAAIVRAATQLPAGRRMEVVCGSLPATMLRLCGADTVGSARLTVREAT
ncbi:MEDS domain-containing protein [Dactylosporangium sp. NPDC000521]|uniref:MEDS domain-containing protein n=1 Tax=Dactylosporangium sp. NPDC000521 TaxID=3363975 RepID=UPI0036A8CD30